MDSCLENMTQGLVVGSQHECELDVWHLEASLHYRNKFHTSCLVANKFDTSDSIISLSLSVDPGAKGRWLCSDHVPVLK